LLARLEMTIQTIKESDIKAAAIANQVRIGFECPFTQVDVLTYCCINGSRFKVCAGTRFLANLVLLQGIS
jgi:hypothetical protein